MSLINDALKRAKEARPESAASTSPNLPFRPAEPVPQAARHSVGLLLPVSLALVALLTLLLLWELSKREGSSTSTQPNGQLAAAARTIPGSEAARATVAPAARPASASPAPKTSAALKSVAGNTFESTTATPVNSTRLALNPVLTVAGTNSAAPAQDTGQSNLTAPTEPSPPAPAALKLQGIVFDPRRPSAMINGHVMFIGDHIRDLRVVSIHQDNVLLVGVGQTNLLSLEP